MPDSDLLSRCAASEPKNISPVLLLHDTLSFSDGECVLCSHKGVESFLLECVLSNQAL